MFAAPGDPTQRPEERGGGHLCENDDVMLENLDHAMASQQNKVRRRSTACPSERLSTHVDPGPRDLVEKLRCADPSTGDLRCVHATLASATGCDMNNSIPPGGVNPPAMNSSLTKESPDDPNYGRWTMYHALGFNCSSMPLSDGEVAPASQRRADWTMAPPTKREGSISCSIAPRLIHRKWWTARSQTVMK